MCLRVASMAVSVLIMISCGAQTPTSPVGPTIKTYKAIWINSLWEGGQTGEASNTKAVGIPSNFTGTYCPVNSLILENHSSRYQAVFSNSRNVLVFKNTCNENANLMVCVSAGSGGNFSEFPICNVDPRTTPASRLAQVNMGPNNSGIQSTTWREAGLGLSLNVFYCGVGDTLTLGAVSGADPTDCFK